MNPRDPKKHLHEISYLYITDGELYHWLGPEAAEAMVTQRGWETRLFLGIMAALAFFVVASSLIAATILLPGWLSASMLYVAWMVFLLAAVPLTFVTALGLLVNRWLLRIWPAAAIQRTPRKALVLTRGLVAKARQFNELIQQIELVHKLRDLGHDVTCDMDARVIQGLRGVREELRRAMQTDRLLRTHPVKSPIVDLDFNLADSAEVLETKMAAQEHSLLLRQALEIGAQVREDMDRLVRRAGAGTATAATDFGLSSELDSETGAGSASPFGLGSKQPGSRRGGSATTTPPAIPGTPQKDSENGGLRQ